MEMPALAVTWSGSGDENEGVSGGDVSTAPRVTNYGERLTEVSLTNATSIIFRLSGSAFLVPDNLPANVALGKKRAFAEVAMSGKTGRLSVNTVKMFSSFPTVAQPDAVASSRGRPACPSCGTGALFDSVLVVRGSPYAEIG